MKSYQRLFAELKRRHVFRVMAVYGIVGFIVLQVVDLAVPALLLPDWTYRFVALLLLIGLPIATVLAWAFEQTPGGWKGTEPADRDELEAIVAQPASKRWPAGLLALVGVAALVAGAWWVGRQTAPAGITEGHARAPSAITDTTPAKSVAVLPFADLSEAGDQQWFADGVTEEILNSLAALPELKVTARTSSFLFRGRDRDIEEIADTLGVAHIVEGSVRRIGDDLVVTAQLIRTSDGTHLWSNTYERSSEDLFNVQRDVAEKVATALKVLLDEEKREAMFRSGTRSVQAFEAYLRGMEESRRWHADDADPESDAGQAEFERALELDPDYAQAAIAHVDRYAHVLMDGLDIGVSQKEARAALLRDLEVAAENASSPTMRLVAEVNAELFSPTWFRMDGLIERLAAHPDVEQLREEQKMWLPLLLIVADRTLARRLAEAAVAANPLDPVAWSNLANIELAEGRTDAALATVARARRMTGQHSYLETVENVVALRGDSARAREILEAVRERSDGQSTEVWPQAGLLVLYAKIGDRASAAALTGRIDALPAGSAIFIRHLATTGTVLFDLADAPNFARNLEEAEIDLSGFGVPAATRAIERRLTP